MRREGGTTLTSLTSASAIALRRFSLLLPLGYACSQIEEMLLGKQLSDAVECWMFYLSHLTGVKVGACQQVFQMGVPLRLCLLQHDHGVGLPEE